MQEMRVRFPLVPLFDSLRPSRLSEETVGLRTRSAWFNSTDGRHQRVAQSEERLFREQEAAGAGPASLTASRDAVPCLVSRPCRLEVQDRWPSTNGGGFESRQGRPCISIADVVFNSSTSRPHRESSGANPDVRTGARTRRRPSRAVRIPSMVPSFNGRTADCRSANAGSIPVGTALSVSLCPSRLSDETIGWRTRNAWFNSTDGRLNRLVRPCHLTAQDDWFSASSYGFESRHGRRLCLPADVVFNSSTSRCHRESSGANPDARTASTPRKVLSFSGLGRPIVDRSTRVRFPSGPPLPLCLVVRSASSHVLQTRRYRGRHPGPRPTLLPSSACSSVQESAGSGNRRPRERSPPR